MEKNKTKDLIMCSLFVALIVVGAFIKIPVPVVPFTLQLLFTMMAGLLLGGKLGALSVCVYILIGTSRTFLNYLYAMVPYVIKEAALL